MVTEHTAQAALPAPSQSIPGGCCPGLCCQGDTLGAGIITQMPEQRVSWKWGKVVPICCGHICSMLVSGQTQEWASKGCSGGHWLPSLGHQHQSSSCRSTSHPSGESGHYAVLQEKPKILASDFFFVLVAVGRFLLLPSKAMIPFSFPGR